MNQVSTSTSPFCCRICDQRAHGNHFGVISCRACAAFFRRTASGKWDNQKCRGGSCDKKTYYCKPCRLQKCRDMGMDTTKFQFNRDNIPTAGQFQLPPQTFEAYVGRPEFLLFCDTDAPNSKVLIDVRYLLEEAGRLLNNGIITPIWAENQLKKLTQGFKHIKLDTDNIKKVETADQKEFMEMWEYYFITVTKWLMYFDEFQKLNRQIQMTMLQAIWHVFSKLHKYVATSAYQKATPRAKPTEVIIKDVMMDIETVNFDCSWMSDYPTKDVFKFLSAQACKEMDIVGTLHELDPTDLEITYLFAQLCFEYVGKRYQGDILRVAEQFQEILANDLHHYYVEEMNRPRYFQRLARLLKVNNAIQRAIWESRPKMELGRVFNVLKIEFSHPEMFEDSGYY
ncbi:NR LBD domain-containing protein [Caenorhabditis elegans]|uniref:NR LBD domain-containing protein n=2 Tax=Caenorhabditis elegans TaxID=6239 RepID=H2L0M9_CAEEL|nr:NR LBD domain-containing protein [Caenorhabditis elegans]CCD74246.1 NR LBD domain-containing protein [Caenorhabditis elegans]|eukprot:NP_001041172.1 Nuclear Hormone Receptor family [Caenorhabditis elegans]